MDASLSIPGDQNLLIIDVIYKTALIDQLLHEGREGLALIGLTGGLISNDTGLKINLYQITFFDLFGCFLTFDDGKSDIDGIPIEDAGEGFSDDATPAALIAIGACSLEDPQPKFLRATIRSPALFFLVKSASMSSMQCFASSAGSDELRYLAGIITSVSMLSPNA